MKVILLLAILNLALCNKRFFDQESIIKIINEKRTSWTAGHNKFFDGKTLDEIKQLMGTKKSKNRLQIPIREVESVGKIPTTFNSSENWPNCSSILEIPDQGACGSSWAFGVTSVLSDRICIASKQKLQVRISTEDALTCCDGCGIECKGGFLSTTWEQAVKQGFVTGGPYNDKKWCSPYMIKPCDHFTEGRFDPCPSERPPPPKCKK